MAGAAFAVVLQALAIAAPAAHAATPTVTCTSDPNIFNTGYNAATGGILPTGTTDPNWQVAGPFPVTSPAATAAPPPANAVFGAPVVGNQAPGAWTASPYGNAQWIAQPGTGHINGDWYYRFQFALDPAVDPPSFRLQMNFLADNTVFEVYVNGVPQSSKTTGLPQNTSSPYTYAGFTLANAAQTTLTSDWQTGLNTIDVQIKSFGPNAEGFLAQIRPSAVCPVSLEITKSASPERYEPGQALQYTITATNDGPGSASGLSIVDQLPPALSGGGFSWTCTATVGSNCPPSGTGDVNDVPALPYPGPTLAAGGTLTYLLTGTVPASTSGTLTNTARLTPLASTTAPGCTPSCSATATVEQVFSDLELTKTATAVVDPGEPVTWLLTVVNKGLDPSGGGTVIDAIPAGVTNVAAPNCTVAGQNVTCDVDPLAVNASQSFVITGDAPNTPSTCFSNDARVTADGIDPTPGNDRDRAETCTTPVAPPPVTADCNGTPATAVAVPGVTTIGTSADDVIVGTAGPDEIQAGGGDDQICALEGDDLIGGGEGDDQIAGGEGDDQIAGESGADRLYGGRGADGLLGGDGDDQLHGGADDDRLGGAEGNDLLLARAGDDTIDGGGGDDALGGNAGDDDLAGGSGTDELGGGSGADRLRGGSDPDELRGAAGEDTIFGSGADDKLRGGADDDALDGGSGADSCGGGGGVNTLGSCE